MCDMGLACLCVCMQAARSDESSWIKVDVAKDPRYPLSWFVVLAAHPLAHEWPDSVVHICACMKEAVLSAGEIDCQPAFFGAVGRWNPKLWGMLSVTQTLCQRPPRQASWKGNAFCYVVSQYVHVTYGAWLFEQHCQFVGQWTYWQLQFPLIHRSIHPSIQLPAIHNLSSVFVVILSQ